MRQQARGLERRQRIVAAAQRILLRDGFTGLTHRAVAAEAGVPLGSTTYYFSDRQELVRAAVDAFLASERDRRRGITPAGSTLPEIAAALVTLMVPPDVSSRAELTHVYQRYTEALGDPDLATLIGEDAADLRSHAARLLSIAGLQARTGMVLALVDGRIIQWIASPDPPAPLDALIADDLRHITA